ncbi:MAG: LAGLIDADG family homing endonuclease [Candidatus Aenigmatarchaeota archaeon]
MGGGCLRGDSLILTNPEGPVEISSIKPGMMVYTINEKGEIEKRKVLAAMKTGVKKIFEVKTKNRTLYASFDHPFLRVKKLNNLSKGRFSKFTLEWVEAQNLRSGDLVVMLREVPDEGKPFKLPNEKETTEEFCRLFGFLLGDGWISKNKKSWRVYFSPSLNKEKNEFYKSLLEKIFEAKVKKGENWFYMSSKRAYEILEYLDLKKRAKNKEIPAWIFSLPKSQKIAFILGLADADGNFYKSLNKNGKEKIELRFEMASKKLIRELKVLCDSIGLRTGNVLFRKRKVKPPHSKEEKIFESWSLRIYEVYKLDKGLIEKRKKFGIGFLYEYRGPTNLNFFKHFGFGKIISVKEKGEDEVFDITVEGSHNFIAEGFVVHNTGSGSLPVIAEISKKLGALTVGIVTLPFSMEGKQRMENAKFGLKNLEEFVDTLIVIPNDKLLEVVPDVSLLTAFKICDEILVNAVKGITELVTKPGLVNLDFADVRAVMQNGGLGVIGLGESNTENRAIEAVEKALSNPLINLKIDGAKGALINVMGGPDITVKEAHQIVETVSTKLSQDAKIIWGAQIYPELENSVRALLIVTGIEAQGFYEKLLEKSVKIDRKEIEKMLGVDFVR